MNTDQEKNNVLADVLLRNSAPTDLENLSSTIGSENQSSTPQDGTEKADVEKCLDIGALQRKRPTAVYFNHIPRERRTAQRSEVSNENSIRALLV